MNREATGTADIVQRLLAGIARGDFDGIAGLFADHVDWRMSWPPDAMQGPVPWIRARHTPSGIGEHFRVLAEHNQPHGAGTTVDRVLIDGADAVLLGTIRNVMVRSGTPYEAHFALHLTVEDGRISRYHIYEDSLAVARAWEGDRALAAQ